MAETATARRPDCDPRSEPGRPGPTPPPPPRSRLLLAVAVCVAAVAVLGLAGLALGSRVIDPSTTWSALTRFDPADDAHLVVRELRVPRTALALLAGACLGLAGALMQSLTRNALAEPGTLGVNAGAAAGVVAGLLLTGTSSIVVYVWFALAGATAAAFVVHRLGRAGDAGVNPVRLVLAGAGLTIMLSSFTTMAVLSSQERVFDSFRNWATGSLQGRGWEPLPVVGLALAAGALLALLLAGRLNAVALGPDMAQALGVNLPRTWALTNVAVLILAGAATAAIGPVSFIGLAAPHAARAITGPDHRRLLVLSALMASVALLAADVLGRLVLHPGEIGAGVMSALLGAPFFIALVRRGAVTGL